MSLSLRQEVQYLSKHSADRFSNKNSNNIQALLKYNQVLPVSTKIVLSEAAAVYADTLPVPVIGASRGGWKYTKDVTGSNKFNYYFFSNQVANPMLLSELEGFWMCGTIDTFVDATSVPFLVLYTLPTGSGDAAAWYKSRIAYSIDLSKHHLYSGEKIVLYWGKKPEFDHKHRHFELTQTVTTGTAAAGETVNLLSAHCDSAVPAGYSTTIQGLGWTNKHVKMNIHLKN
tara:strand:- start:3066 stop:3752 length:687 start_codon:yes stop_codon:yes gene_type:complete